MSSTPNYRHCPSVSLPPSPFLLSSLILSFSEIVGTKTIKNVMIVDRNQGLGTSPCSPGDVDVSDFVYEFLDETTALGSELQGVTWSWSG